jgi:hypothetical protein
MAGVNVKTLGILLLITIAVYIIFIRGEGFTNRADTPPPTPPVIIPISLQEQATKDKTAAELALEAANKAKKTAEASAKLVVDAQKDVDRLQKLADKETPANRKAAQKLVTDAVEAASTKVGTARTEREIVIDKAKDSATAATKYASSSAQVSLASRDALLAATEDKNTSIRNLQKLTEEITELTGRISSATSILTSAPLDAQKSIKLGLLASQQELVRTNTKKEEDADKKAKIDEALAKAALDASTAAAKFLQDAGKIPSIVAVSSTPSSSKDTKTRSKNNPSLSRNLTKGQPPRATSTPDVTPSSTSDSTLSSTVGAFIGAAFGGLLGTVLTNYIEDEREYNNPRSSAPPNSKYMSDYTDPEESEWTRGGPSPPGRYSYYTDVTEYNDEDPEAMCRQGKSVDTCNLHSVDCGKPRCNSKKCKSNCG